MRKVIEVLREEFGLDVDVPTALRVWKGVTDAAPHTWMNAFACVNPTDDYAAEVGRSVIRQVMDSSYRNAVIRLNAS